MKDSVSWDSATLRKRLEQNPAIKMIDVRSPAEYETVHIPGSYNIPMNMLDEHGPRLRENVRAPVVFVCQSGARARKVHEATSASPEVRKLVDAGLTHLHVLEGGIKDWVSAGGTVNRGRQRWSMERQIRFITGSIVLLCVCFSILVPWLKWIAAFVGAGLAFAALINFCAMELMLAQMPWNRANRADVDAVVDKLVADTQASRSPG